MKSLERVAMKNKSKSWSGKTHKGRKAQRHHARHLLKLELRKSVSKLVQASKE